MVFRVFGLLNNAGRKAMTRFVCEGIRVRIDDVFAGSDNGKEFYLNLGSFNGDIKSFESAEDMEDIKLQFQLNDGRDYSGELKDLIVESVIHDLETEIPESLFPWSPEFPKELFRK